MLCHSKNKNKCNQQTGILNSSKGKKKKFSSGFSVSRISDLYTQKCLQRGKLIKNKKIPKPRNHSDFFFKKPILFNRILKKLFGEQKCFLSLSDGTSSVSF